MERTSLAKSLRKRASEAEQTLWRHLRNRRFQQHKFRRQHPFGSYVLDFYCSEVRLAIELDGGGHDRPSRREQDHVRSQFLASQNIRVVRFWNNDVHDNLEGVLEHILTHLKEPSAHHPLPQGEGRGEGQRDAAPIHSPSLPQSSFSPHHPLPQGEGRSEGQRDAAPIHSTPLPQSGFSPHHPLPSGEGRGEGSLSASQIKAHARSLGFDLCGITSADAAPFASYYQQWVEAGQQGEMGWLARDPERRSDPRRVLSGAQSIICVALNYYQPPPSTRGRIATYALGDDYHAVFEEKLAAFQGWLTAQAGGSHKFYVDTGPVLEKGIARRAGIGWQGKSTMLLHKNLGPWLFLGEILTTLALDHDAPARDHCGSCERCMDACPTHAITAPYQLDARRCISYLTIELKGSIPEEMRPLIGDRIYGCDECLTACPWNRFAQTSREARFSTSNATTRDLRDYLSLTPQEFKQLFANSPILRVKRRGFLRNVCVALGNIGTADDLPALQRTFNDEEPLVREHAEWAIGEIKKRPGAPH